MPGIIKVILAGIVFLIALFALHMAIGQVPDTKVVAGEKLSTSAKQSLIDADIVSSDETVHYFYSEDLFSFDNFGNLFTDTRVVSYELDYDTDERVIYSATYSEISDIEFNKSDSLLDDSTINIYVAGVYQFLLVVSPEAGGDQTFYDSLAQTWKANRPEDNMRIDEPAEIEGSIQNEIHAKID